MKTEIESPVVPSDPTFERWAEEGLVWLPEKGMGRLVVKSAPYDEDYFRKYQEYACTEMGEKITSARVALVNAFTSDALVDVGIGCGSFVETRGPGTFGYDVNPAGVEWLNERGRFQDPYAAPVDSISMWDVLEHIPEPDRLLRNVLRYVFVSLPLVPGDGPPKPDWKHLRRDEHCWYWTRVGFMRWMSDRGFRIQRYSEVETFLGREDIGTFVFRRVS